MPIVLLLASLAVGPKDPDALEAKALAHRATVEYNAGDFERSLADATRAYELSSDPGLLYDLGQCHRELHHWERAAFFFRGYLRERPDAKDRAEVVALLAELAANEREARRANEPARATAAQAPPAIASVSLPKPVAPAPAVATAVYPVPASAVAAPPLAAPEPLPWAVGIAGVASAIVGAGAWALALTARTGYVTRGQEPMPYSSIAQSNAEMIAGDVLVPLGVALLALALGIDHLERPAPPGPAR